MLEQPKPRARHAEPRLLAALSDTRIVALVGPRQSGKTTLARKIAAGRKMSFIKSNRCRSSPTGPVSWTGSSPPTRAKRPGNG
jgi:hypothetical protein